MNITYCENWNGVTKSPLHELEAEVALERHKTGKYYAAILGPPEKPTHVVFLAGIWVKVNLFDDWLRIYLSYDFKTVQKGRLFLTVAIWREFRDDTKEVVRARTLRFELDGFTLMSERDMLTGKVIEKQGVFDPGGNWDNFPVFGKYQSVCRKERLASFTFESSRL